MNRTIKLMIADDHPVFTQGMALLFKHYPEIEVIGIAPNGRELLLEMKRNPPDVVLLDINMPVMNGFETFDKIKKQFRRTKVIIVSSNEEKPIIARFLIKGANGYLRKSEDIDIVVSAIKAVYRGHFFFEQEISSMVNESLIKSAKKILRHLNLTLKELDILRLICEEKSNDEIARVLDISIKTVEFHKANIYEKTGTKSLAGLINFANKNGLNDVT